MYAIEREGVYLDHCGGLWKLDRVEDSCHDFWAYLFFAFILNEPLPDTICESWWCTQVNTNNKSTYTEFWVRCYDKEDLSKNLPDDGKSVVPEDDLGTGK